MNIVFKNKHYLYCFLRIFLCVNRFRIVFSTVVGSEIVDICFHKYGRQKTAADARFHAHLASALQLQSTLMHANARCFLSVRKHNLLRSFNL